MAGEKAGVTVAQKSVFAGNGMIVDVAPAISTGKCCHEQ